MTASTETLETTLRRKYSDEGLQERVNEVNNDSTIDDSERAERLRELLDPDAQTKLGNLAIEIRLW